MDKKIYKAGAYIRLSREDGNKFEESNSIKNQRDLINEFIDEQDDISIYGYYSDDGRTGTNFDRPGFQRMMKDMYDKKIDCIIVKDLSRFGRNYIEVGRYIDYIFPSMGIRFISINDNIDNVKNPESLNSVIVPFKNLMNDEYCRDIARKVKKVKEVQRLNGEITSGSAPYGYLLKDKNYVIDLEVKDIITMIFEMCIAGESSTKIAYKLNEENIDCPKEHFCKRNNVEHSKKYYWDSTKISNILKNEVYCGTLVQGKTTTLNNKVRVSVPVPKEDWIRVENHHEPIIDKETFKKAQECILSRTTATKLKRNVFNSIFRGYLKCYDCKKNMVKTSCNKYKDKTYLVYNCFTYKRMSKKLCLSRSIKYEELMSKVIEKINSDTEFLIDFEINKLDSMHDNEELVKIADEISLKNKRMEELENLKKEILYDLKKDLITNDDYDFYFETYNNEMKKLLKELNKLKEKEFTLSHDKRIIKDFIRCFKKYRNLDELNEKILEELIEVIYVKSDKSIEIIYLNNDVYEMIRNFSKEISNGEK